MLKIFKKYNKHLISLIFLSMVLLPVVVGAESSNSNGLAGIATRELDKASLGSVYGSNNNDLPQMIGNGIGVVLGLLGLILVVLIIYAGFLWMTAQGDAKKVEKAKDMIKQAIIGLIIVFAAYAITTFVIDSISNAVSGNVNG